jgi:hypothetical protein
MLHGTRTHSPARLAHSPDGFDLDGNPDCSYARAIYFAQRSCYSHAYAHRTADAEGERPDPRWPRLAVARGKNEGIKSFLACSTLCSSGSPAGRGLAGKML